MKKLILLITTLFIAFSTAIAMPGFNSYIPDKAGEFVYYRDYSFSRESYIGFLKYDDSTYQIRYYSPHDSKQKLMEKNLALAVTVNPASNFWDMTGEVILQAPQNNEEDIEILNYLHDILYEFSSRRIKVGNISPASKGYINSDIFKNSGFAVTEKYDQFGGTVTTLYDVLIPLWNVKSIVDYTGKVLFDCVTIGRLSSNNDKSFDEFKGFSNVQNKGKVQKFKKSVPAEINIKDNNLKVIIDSNWTAVNDFIYLLGDEANISAYGTAFKGNYDAEKKTLWTLRLFLAGSEKSYTDISSIEIINKTENERFTKISYKSYLPDSKNIIYTTRLINIPSNSKENVNLFSLSVNLNAYTKKKAYYDGIIKSCSFEN
jgi:hypothetical protein